MAKKEIRIEQGYCPEINRDRNIEVRFLVAHALGGVSYLPKFDSTYCLDEQFCQFVFKYGRCPPQDEIATRYC